jgi:ABC-2 type transport system ATP-binding protein
VRLDDPARQADAERILGQVLGAGVHNGTDAYSLTARVDGNGRIPDALSALASAGVGVAELTLGQPSLDDVFFALTGKTAEPTKEEVTA